MFTLALEIQEDSCEDVSKELAGGDDSKEIHFVVFV